MTACGPTSCSSAWRCFSRQGRSFATDYWQQVVKKTGAKLVIPVHWDDFERPLD